MPISVIGSVPNTDSPRLAVRGQGEQAARTAFRDANIIRSSVMFGPDDAFLRNLAAITRLPLVPLFGRGRTRLQPVYVEAMATAFARLLAGPETAGRTYELGGGAVYTYHQILELALATRAAGASCCPCHFLPGGRWPPWPAFYPTHR